MKTQYKYLSFVQLPAPGKTTIWSCKTVKGGVSLGVVKWLSTWRQYCYFPECQAVYSSGCLTDIAHFLQQLNQPEVNVNE